MGSVGAGRCGETRFSMVYSPQTFVQWHDFQPALGEVEGCRKARKQISAL
jgi:hypothetical protein